MKRLLIIVFMVLLFVPFTSALTYAEEETYFLLWSYKEAKVEKEVVPPEGNFGIGGIPFRENESPLFVVVGAEIVPSYVPVEIKVWAALRGKGGEHYTVTVMRNVAQGLRFLNATLFYPALFPPYIDVKIESMGFSVYNPNQVDVIVSVHFVVGYTLSEVGVPLKEYNSLKSNYNSLSLEYRSLQTMYHQHVSILIALSIALACLSIALAVKQRKLKKRLEKITYHT